MLLYYIILYYARVFLYIYFFISYIIIFFHNFITKRATPENLRLSVLFVNISKNNTITRGKQGTQKLTKNAKQRTQ